MTKSSKTQRKHKKYSHDNKKIGVRLIFVMFYDSRPNLNT